MKKILVPIDGSVFTEAAIAKAKEIAAAFGSDIVLLNVIGIYPGAFPYEISEGVQINLLKESRANAKELLAESKEKFGEMKDRVETVMEEGNIADTIIKFSEKNNVDLIVMGSNGLGGLHNLLIGSVTRKVAIHGSKPILIVKQNKGE